MQCRVCRPGSEGWIGIEVGKENRVGGGWDVVEFATFIKIGDGAPIVLLTIGSRVQILDPVFLDMAVVPFGRCWTASGCGGVGSGHPAVTKEGEPPEAAGKAPAIPTCEGSITFNNYRSTA